MSAAPEFLDLPPELVIDIEPDALPALCTVCETGPAAYSDPRGVSHICQTCIDEHPDEIPGLVPYQPWQIGTLGEAEWAMAKYRQAQSKIDEIRTTASGHRERIAKWEEREAGKHQSSADFFAGHLQRFAAELREQDPKAKTLTLVGGKVTSRRVNPKVVVVDEAAAIEFIRSYAAEMGRPQEDFLKVEVKLKKKELDSILVPAALQEGLALVLDGEEVPGVEVEPERVEFKVVVET